jgi:hypothetical protein
MWVLGLADSMTDDNFVVMVDLGAREVAARFEASGQISEIPLKWDPRTVETTVRARIHPLKIFLFSLSSISTCSILRVIVLFPV